jgi:drug/metabolite transporter (DMT)-like permease
VNVSERSSTQSSGIPAEAYQGAPIASATTLRDVNPRVRLYVMLGVLSLLWGFAFVGIKEVLDEISPTTLTILRFAIADLCLIAVLVTVPSTRPRFERRDLWRIVVLGVTGVPMYHLALNWGEQRTNASVAALIVATAPVMVALGSAAVLRERVTARRWLGIALAFVGVAVLATAHRTSGGSTSLIGVIVSMLAPVSWAIYSIVAKPLTERASSLQVTAAGMLIGSIALLPFLSARTFREIGGLSATGWAWMALLGVGSSVMGYFIFVWALARMDATRVSVFLYAVPLVAITTAWLILDEPLGASVLFSAVLVIAGVVLAQQERSEQPTMMLRAENRG